MSSATYAARALVLRRTKLGESDVICTLLASDGSQVRAVAKGARKPSSTFSSRLEVFAVCDLLLSHGRSLDLVKEARLVEANAHLRSDLDAMEAAAPMVELLDRSTQVGLEDERLFAMTCAALAALSGCPADQMVKFTSAHLLKTLAILGFRPRFDACVSCGAPFDVGQASGLIPFSLVDGGVVCEACRAREETIVLDAAVAQWAQALLFSTFDEIGEMAMPPATSFAVLRFLQLWIRQHLGLSCKALTFLLCQA